MGTRPSQGERAQNERWRDGQRETKKAREGRRVGGVAGWECEREEGWVGVKDGERVSDSESWWERKGGRERGLKGRRKSKGGTERGRNRGTEKKGARGLGLARG